MTITISPTGENDALKWVVKGITTSHSFYKASVLDNLGNVVAGSTTPTDGIQIFDNGNTASTLRGELTFVGLPTCTISTVVVYDPYMVETMRFPLPSPISVTSGDNLYINGLSGVGVDPSNYITIGVTTGAETTNGAGAALGGAGKSGVEEVISALRNDIDLLTADGTRHISIWDGSTQLFASGTGYYTLTWVSMVGGGMTNSNRLVWNDMPACTVTHWSMDNFYEPLWKSEFDTPISVSAGQKFVIEPGDLVVRIAGV